MRGAAGLAAVISAGLFFGGCDSAPGVMDTEGTPPVVDDLEFSPDVVVFEFLPDEQIIGDSIAVFDVDISASAFDIDGDIDSVGYVVNSPFDPFEPLKTGTLSRIGTGSRYAGTARLRILRGNTALYTLIVFAVDSEGQVSNQVRGLIDYQLGTGSPPVIVAVEGPAEIRPPVQLTLVAVVTDPDGLGNIARVVVTAPNGSQFDMVDDGQTFGDTVAGDGRYTARFDVPEAEPGTFRFQFQAFDRQGLASEIVTKDITVL